MHVFGLPKKGVEQLKASPNWPSHLPIQGEKFEGFDQAMLYRVTDEQKGPALVAHKDGAGQKLHVGNRRFYREFMESRDVDQQPEVWNATMERLSQTPNGVALISQYKDVYQPLKSVLESVKQKAQTMGLGLSKGQEGMAESQPHHQRTSEL